MQIEVFVELVDSVYLVHSTVTKRCNGVKCALGVSYEVPWDASSEAILMLVEDLTKTHSFMAAQAGVEEYEFILKKDPMVPEEFVDRFILLLEKTAQELEV